MKKITLTALSAIAVIACNKEPKIDYALLNGTIQNAKVEKAIISNADYKKEIAINEDGSFADTLWVESGFYNLNIGKESTTIYLEPAFNVQLTLDTNEFDETITYQGVGSESNNYLAKKFLTNEKNNVDLRTLYSLEEDAFLSEIKKQKEAATSAISAAQNLDEDFIALEQKDIDYQYLNHLNSYQNYHAYLTKKETFEPSENFKNEAKALDSLNYDIASDYKNLMSYKQLASAYYGGKIQGIESVDSIVNELNAIQTQAIKNDISKNLAYQVSPSNENAEKLYNAIMNVSSDDEFKKKLEDKYNIIKTLTKGNPSPVFENYENYNGGTTSLADLKGKYVYIDVWATWCGPCKAEIPFLKEVEAAYHGKNIEFVSISIDQAKDHDAWKKMVAEKELKGIQLFADKDWSSDFVKNYAINGIPRFILLDTEGNIISADAARPSNPELKETLNELL